MGNYRRLTKEEQHKLRAKQIEREGIEINPKDLDTQLEDRIRGYMARDGFQHPFTLEEFKTKFGANPECYLTGIPINYADPYSFHLEHFIPHVRGGPSSLDNLRLCHPYANRLKHNRTHPEFLKFCRLVVAYADKQNEVLTP